MTRPPIIIHHGPAPARERPKPRTLDQEIEMATRGIDLAIAITPHDDVRAALEAYRAAVVDMLTIAYRVREERA